MDTGLFIYITRKYLFGSNSMKESDIQKWVLSELKGNLIDSFFFKVHQSRYSTAGIPDIVGVANGKFIAVEVKTEKGRTTKLQTLCLMSLKKAGAIVIVIKGKDADQLKEFIESIKND